MKQKIGFTFFIAFFSLSYVFSAETGIAWQDYSDKAFSQALSEKKLIILDLKAVWCHWCHVMDEKTYANDEVIKLINKNYVAMKVDQDSRPDISHKYEDYGWPATIFFNSQGKEIAKRAGYIAPDKMKALLISLYKNPNPLPDEKLDLKEAANILNATQVKAMQKRMDKVYDPKVGGWNLSHKLLDANFLEYSLLRAQNGDKVAETRVKKDLQVGTQLIDPVWSGVYQYSTGYRWDEPHYEKIMSIQTDNIKIYSLAATSLKNPDYLKSAVGIESYMQKFLTSEEGAFYTSQDADVKPGQQADDYFKLNDLKRRAIGIPRIDQNIYARENGWMIQALVSLYAATSDQKHIDAAKKSAQWIIANRSLPNGGFSHSRKDAGGPFLGDSLAMANAFLKIYSATGEREWLQKSQKTTDYIYDTFPAGYELKNKDKVGWQSTIQKSATSSNPVIQSEENLALTRFTNLLYRYTGNDKYHQMALQGMRYLTTEEVREYIYISGGILLANEELSQSPVHITIVGGKQDALAKNLFQAALRYPSTYIRLDWYDSSEGPLPFSETTYPKLSKPAAFACSGKRCSLPAYKADDISERVKQLQSQK